MASFKVMVAVVLYYCFSFTMSETSWEYQSLNRKINLMWRTFEKCSSFETEIRRLQFEMEDLKSELQTERKKFEELRKQLPVSGYQTKGANQEPEIESDRLSTPVDSFNKLNNRLTLAMQSINNTVNRIEDYDIIIRSLQNDSTTTKSSVANTASTVDQIQRYVSNKFNQLPNVSALVTIISHAFEEEKIKRKHVEDELKQSISSKMFDLQLNQRRFKKRVIRSLDNVAAHINTTVEVSKREVLINITDALIATQTLFKTKMDTADVITSSTKSLLCGNGYIKFGLDKTPICECETGYSGVHCNNGEWSSWSTWSSCGVTCGGGIRSRDRACNYTLLSPHGQYCPGRSYESSMCSTSRCPDIISAFTVSRPHSMVSWALTFSTTIFNQGGDFDPSTGLFTCTKPGVYYFTVSLIKKSVRVDEVYCFLYQNDSSKLRIHVDPVDDDTDKRNAQASNFALLHLARGDIVKLYYCSGPPSITMESWTSFSGFLVYPDV